MKQCRGCKETKPFAEFYSRKGNTDGHQYQCKKCQSLRLASKYKENPRHYRERSYKRLYGLTISEVETKLKEQHSCCAICSKDISLDTYDRKKTLVVDHDHYTGKVRGLLCHSCNVGIGNLKDDINIVEKALAYLRSFK